MATKYLFTILMLLFSAGGSDTKHRYIFVYTVPILDPYIQTAMVCIGDPHCNDVYHPEERHAWFDSLPDALKAMNQFEHPSGVIISTGQTWPSQYQIGKRGSIIGLYEVTQIPAVLIKVGTEHQQVQKYVDEEIPRMEWQVKP